MASEPRVLRRGEMSYRHHAIIDQMLANPHLSKGEIAERLGFTQAYFSQVINTDLFRAEYERRLREYQGDVQFSIAARLNDQAHAAMDVIDQELRRTRIDEETGEEVLAADPRFALDAQHKVLQAMGFVDKKTPAGVQVNVQQNNAAPGAVDRDSYERARRRMTFVQTGEEPADAPPDYEG